MRKPRIDVLYTNLALEAAYARADSITEILAIAESLKALAAGHDPKAKGGKISPDALRGLADRLAHLAKKID